MKTLLLLFLLTAALPSGNWPMFRGTGNSLTAAKNLPLSWSESENIAWQQQLTGYGQSSPVVWEDLVIVTSTQGDNKETLLVEAFSLKTGESAWTYTQNSSSPKEVSNYISQSAPTPAIDENQVFAFFESGDVIALSHQGELNWKRDLQTEFGKFEGNHGLGCSPSLTKQGVVILIDHSGPSYLLAINKETGKDLWKTDRPERVSWSSPIVNGFDETQRVLVSSNGSVQQFDAQTGKLIWEQEGIKGNNVPSPTVNQNYIAIASKSRGQNQLLQLNEDKTNTEVVWKNATQTSSFCSPLIHQDYVYYVNKAGVASCLSLKTGKESWKERLPGSCWASPIGAGDRVYFFSNEGTTTIVESKGKFNTLASNELPTKDKVYGVAAVNDCILIRTGKKLTCIKQP